MGLVFRWLSRVPLALLHALGALLGWVVYGASGDYRRRFKANVAQAGIRWADARPAIAAAGRMAAELPWLWIATKREPLGAKLRWDGAELLAATLEQKRGLIVMTPHMGCFEMCAQAIAERFTTPEAPITVLYRPARQASMREVMAGSRERPGLATAPASLAGVRQMIRALRKGEVIGLLPDQVPPDGLGVWAPFFGKPAYTMTLAARLVQQTGAALLLIWGERLPGGQGFVVHVLPAPEIAKDASPEDAAATINAAMESVIRRAPGQYLWGYNRYKAPRGLDIGAAPATPEG
ncbi:MULTISPECIES: lysophospholipid acyltransferase family protein [unclassified Roseateles]|uniref:lysophospholipid acyltransferase family protein n=1 Tax=unclassified Roseateles TaxID=2626991 RepID=UPI0006FD9640|nr:MULTISPECIES: lysophospholipid acyltransferase family protein [unclassified Roseateles]KQW46253.1 lipid A biosynthesis acyltransferase [Pelomonas sp. Root405]KRA73302.1 lipid A biosynthesis acyltransferase [Pelomonas sp. Root662]